MKKKLLLNAIAVFIGILISVIAIEIVLRVQNFVQLDGFHNEFPWHEVLHHGEGSIAIKDFGENCKDGKIKLLLLGDSWMEDENLSNSISSEFAVKTGRCVQTFNGGNSSYSPTLYLLMARRAFQTYGKFDYIIVNIDETDIADEWYRVRIPVIRDPSGKIVAVPYNNDLYAKILWEGKLWAESSNLYIIRLFKFAFYYKVLVPLIYKFTFSPEYSNWMKFVFAPDGAVLYKKEIKYFQDRLLEMATKISRFTAGGPESVFVAHHPHFRGLVHSVDSGKLYLPVVSQAIAELQKKAGVSVLDARSHIKQIHGGAFPDHTYVNGDPFSHLDSDGAVRYGKWLARQIAPK